MKFSKMLLVISGVVVIVALTIVITMGVERAIHRRAFEKRMPHLAKIIGKESPRDLLKTIKMVRAIEVLGLDEEQIAKVIPRWRKLDETREVNRKARKKKLEEIERLLKAEAPAEELENAITSLEELDDKFQSDCKALRDEINQMLTPEQQARLILFEKDFRCQMQKFLQRQPHKRKKPAGPLKKGKCRGTLKGKTQDVSV